MQEADILVDGTAITARDIAAEMQHHPAPSAEEAWQSAARALVVRQVLCNAAAARGLETEGEAMDAAIDALLAENIRIPDADEAACRRWYAAHPERFGTPECWDASHILIAADPEDANERAAAEARATQLLADIQADPSRLPDLARQHSDCPSRARGGHLGTVTRGTSVPELETFLAALTPGQICPVVVKSRYGMHVVQLHAKEPARTPPFEAVRAHVAADLGRAAWHEAARQAIALLASRARIEGFSLDAADGPRITGPLLQ